MLKIKSLNFLLKEFITSIVTLNRSSKRLIAIVTDIFICIFCTWLAFVVRLEEIILLKDFNLTPAIISAALTIPIFWIFGLYRTIFRFTNSSIIFTIASASFIYTLFYFLVVSLYGIEKTPRSIGLIQPMLLFFGIISSRLLVKYGLSLTPVLSQKKLNKKKALIYGAGNAGRQLLSVLENNLEYKVVGFLDDNEQLIQQVLLGKIIYSTEELNYLIKNQNISTVFLALPSILKKNRNIIIDKLHNFKLSVKTLPSMEDIIDNKISISDIKDLDVDDLINRDEISPNLKLLSKNTMSKIILVTGAGGSIGSELCREILKQKPKKLILLELSEFALYKIYEELKSYHKIASIIPLLSNVQDQSKLEKILETFKVDTVYHAAAYKHVPLVEENICEGVKNNVFGTLSLLNAVINKKIQNFVLISSDKAVRPTNIMGASKRLAELCVQGLHNQNKFDNFNFSIVRFGNVIESSGSVIPKFKKQIKDGGPITLTHPEVTRYFMTVTEAAQLVIQAGALNEKSQVFVLDMGKSIKIIDLVYRLVKFSGFSIKDNENQNGEIEIKIIGLRPGEKLYEELLIGDNPKKTIHPRILTAQDKFIPMEQLDKDLNSLRKLLDEDKAAEVKKFLEIKIKLYKSNLNIFDHIYREKMSSNKFQKIEKKGKNKKTNVVKLER